MADRLKKAEQTVRYEKEFKRVGEVKQPSIVDDDFWKVNDEETSAKEYGLEELAGKGLWLANLDVEMRPVLSMQSLSLPKKELPQKPDTHVKSRLNLEEQQERYLKLLRDKQPVGRDGKRIPLPSLPKRQGKLAGSAIAMHKSAELRTSKFSAVS
jgi:hypothetical protein